MSIGDGGAGGEVGQPNALNDLLAFSGAFGDMCLGSGFRVHRGSPKT